MKHSRTGKSCIGFGLGVFVVGLLAGGPAAWGDDSRAVEELKRENVELKKRVEKLEAALTKMQGAVEKPPKESTEEVIDKAVDKTIERLEAKAKGEKPAIRSKYPIDFYGYIKLDASYDMARMDTGNFPQWVESEELAPHDDEFNMTARQTRLGLDFHGPDVSAMKTSGKVEVDFYGGGAENKNVLMMRHAYMQLDWPTVDLSLLAGQTFDVVSPLIPPTLNYTVLWWTGNIGYRRPQIRLSKGFGMGDSKLLFQAAAARPIGSWGWDSFDDETGEDSGFPHLQGRVAYSFPLLTKKPTTIGFSGHYGQDEWDESGVWNWRERVSGRHFSTWSLCADATVPLSEKVAFQGEVWTGENVQTYLGGIGQGVNDVYRRGIAATGGWGAVSLGPFDKWRFNVGAGIDDPRDYDLIHGVAANFDPYPEEKASNSCIFGNILYNVNDAVQIGFELSHWDTEYVHIEDGENWRFQTSFIYSF